MWWCGVVRAPREREERRRDMGRYGEIEERRRECMQRMAAEYMYM